MRYYTCLIIGFAFCLTTLNAREGGGGGRMEQGEHNQRIEGADNRDDTLDNRDDTLDNRVNKDDMLDEDVRNQGILDQRNLDPVRSLDPIVNPVAATLDTAARVTDTTSQKVVSDFDGFRSGYVYRDSAYWAADPIEPEEAYTAPLGAFAGWAIMTQPSYIAYPSYASYPIETAIGVALMQQNYYNGPIDGDISSVQTALESFQATVGLPVTGTVTPDLLRALGISQPE